MADYKEGVDFEYREVKTKDGKTAYKNRHFFTAAEKAARNAPKAAPVKAKAPTPTKTTKAATKPTQDAMKGYRKGDITTAPIGGTGGRTPPKSTASVVATAKQGIDKATKKPQPRHPDSSPRLSGPFTVANTVALGGYTKEEYDAMTPAERVAKGLPRGLGRYAIREETFKPSNAVAPTKKATPTIAQAGKVGRYAKGGMVKGRSSATNKQKGK